MPALCTDTMRLGRSTKFGGLPFGFTARGTFDRSVPGLTWHCFWKLRFKIEAKKKNISRQPRTVMSQRGIVRAKD
jgi:hypothetical protein